MSVKINKNGNEYPLGVIPQHYPADRVYLDGDTSKTVQGELDNKVSKSGDTMSGRLTIDQQSGNSGLWLGNNTAQGDTGASRGLLLLYGLNQYFGQIYDGYGLTANRDYYLPDKTGTIALTSDIPALYEEHTTRETTLDSTMIHHQNQSFLSNGYYSIFKWNKQVTIRIGGISNKSSIDWITVMNSGYRPSRTEYFPYYLGNTLCRGYIQYDGIIYFETLNTSDVLSATITFNIA